MSLTLPYDPNLLEPGDESPENMAIFRLVDGAWQELPTTLDILSHEATATTPGFSQFFVGVKLVDTTPPQMTGVAPEITLEQETYDGTAFVLPMPAAADNRDPSVVVINDAPVVFPHGDTVVTFTATDVSGNTATATTTVHVVDTIPPLFALVPGPFVVEQQEPTGSLFVMPAPVVVDSADPEPTMTSDAPALFPPGDTVVRFTATDSSGNVASAVTVVTVRDTAPPTFTSLTASPSVLWPPNHKFVSVVIKAVAADACDPNPGCRIESVGSSDFADGKGDGRTTGDWRIVDEMAVDLRAERAGLDADRVYSIAVRCADASGNDSTATAEVRVPHSGG